MTFHNAQLGILTSQPVLSDPISDGLGPSENSLTHIQALQEVAPNGKITTMFLFHNQYGVDKFHGANTNLPRLILGLADSSSSDKERKSSPSSSELGTMRSSLPLDAFSGLTCRGDDRGKSELAISPEEYVLPMAPSPTR